MDEQRDNSYVKLPFFGLRNLVPFLRKYKKILFSMVILGIFGSICDVVIPLFQKYAIDHFVTDKTLSNLTAFILLYLAVILF